MRSERERTLGTTITFAPRRRNHAASGTQALRIGSITTVTSELSGSEAHSDSRSSLVVPNRRALHKKRP